MRHLADLDRAALAEGLAAAGADGWLLYEFRGVNPVSLRLLGVKPGTRRLFVYLPKDGAPVAIAHKIELQPLADFPGEVVGYARWEDLHSALARVVAGRTVAMEVSRLDAVPYLDRVPHGVVELLESLGGRVVSSAPLVTTFTARWSAAEADDHRAAAEAIAEVAKLVMAHAVAHGGRGLSESQVQAMVIEGIERAGFVVDPGHLPIIGFGPNAANPHYEPVAGQDRQLGPDEVVLIDLFAGRTLSSVFADQTWMGFSGRAVPEEVARVWTVVRDARDAALATVWDAARQKRPLRGFEVDQAARSIIERAGYGEFFVHRTGHSIDRDLHGSGPHCDNYETRDDRVMMPGVGFSVEPGIYLPGRFGVRSEVNVFWAPGGPVATPAEHQRDLILP
ncbi:MAG: aminopeptidase P family protein [Gemmatimonadetes bacterium]|nr:aminopeptidase P family protein [Gemmatimonadota bacterium]